MQMQSLVSDKTFHLKWNNHLQNLSQLFTTIYSSSALADVTLSCRDGTLKAHKLVLSACSPYFEQIFKDNPCQHPIVILKGIPFSEINLLVEFMYKGSVDVQELDLQSLMHTASELEIRGLAYEARDNAAQLLNVNLEYPAYPTTPTGAGSQQQGFPQARTDVERLKQIHMYQQSMMRAEEIRRRRRDEPGTHTVVNNILAAAAREMEEARTGQGRAPQTDQHAEPGGESKRESVDEERPKKRVSILTPDDERLKKAKKVHMTVRFQENHDLKTDEQRPNKNNSPGSSSDTGKNDTDSKPQGIKVVQLSALQQKQFSNDNEDSDERGGGGTKGAEDDEETDSSGSVSDTAPNESHDGRPHVCEICELRFQRASHLTRHRLTHTGERPFTCGGCGRSFARSDKLRVHTKICERDDPTVDMSADAAATSIKRESSEVMSGTVRTTHRESGHLVFTASGDVMLPPRPSATPFILNSTLDAGRTDLTTVDILDQPRRGRGRPRKTPLPLTPKIKKRRGRPPKTSLDMEGCVLTSGAVMGTSPAHAPQLSVTSHASAAHSHQQSLLMKRKRGRPPKNYFLPRTGPDGRPNENYNASNLPFGDFSYLTDMINYPNLQYSFNPTVTSTDTDRSVDGDNSITAREPGHRTIDVSDTSSDEDDGPKMELEDNVPPVACETQIMTVGDCQIVKLPPGEEKSDDKNEQTNETVSSSTPNSVTITPITTVGDCTIRPLENNT